MGEPGFPGGDNYVYLSFVVVIMSTCIQAVFKDGFLNQSYLLVLFVCSCLFLVSLLVILSRVCVMQAKTGKNPVWKLKDPDSESSSVKEDSENQPKTKFFRFLEARGVYTSMFRIGIAFLIVAVLLEGLSFSYDQSLKSEFDAAAKVLAASGVFFMVVIYQLADSPWSNRSKYAYLPFDEFIRVPMTVFIPRMFLHLANNLYSLFGILFYVFAAVYGLVTVQRMPEKQVETFVKATGFSEVHKVMVATAIVANVSGAILIISKLRAARDAVMVDFLLKFEKNWRWNMAALEFLLGDKEIKSLEELREAYLEKSQKKDLTEPEKKAIRYIEKPLWKGKRPFIGNRELDGIPEVFRSTKAKDAQPSTSKSAQGPQPEEPQPSSSAQRPLRVG